MKYKKKKKIIKEGRRHKAEIAVTNFSHLKEYLQRAVVLVLKKDAGNISKEMVFLYEFVNYVFNNTWDCDKYYFVSYLLLTSTFFVLLLFLRRNYFVWN